MDMVLHTTQPPARVVDGCVAVYAAAFGQPPYRETAADAVLLRERVERYGRRPGFRLPVTADGPDGPVTGFGLAVYAYPGDWWRDRVAGAIGPDLAARWLPAEGTLEVVHVAVDPARQRRGLGRRLLASLTAEARTSTGVLSCDPAAIPAQRLYLAHGWQLITASLSYQPGVAPRWLMGADLAGVPV